MGTANLRKHTQDDRTHVIAARVVLLSGETKHYFVNEEKNIVVSVETHNHGMPMWANLANTPGVWVVPDVGTEVLVATDDGDIEGECYIVGVFPSTNVQNAEMPNDLAPRTFNVVVTGDANIVVGPGSSVHLISDTKIEAASAVGNGVSIAIQNELHAIWSYLMKQFDPATGHIHTVVGGATTAIAESTTPGTAASVPEPHGTDILRGE